MPGIQDHIAGLLDQLNGLQQGADDALDALRRRTEMIIRNTFGPGSDYLSDLNSINFHPMFQPADAEYVASSWNSGVYQFRNLLNTMAEEVALFGSPKASDVAEGAGEPVGSEVLEADGAQGESVFLVHGHDNRAKSETARFLEKLGLNVVILHEQANSGRTIIEKFEHESADAKFAVVLLTADDAGAAKADVARMSPRARQNVVLELGYFLGRLGRSKVAALVDKDVEIPSDFAGVVYIQLDGSDSWKLHLAKEMKNSGLSVDLNRAV